MSAYKQFLTSDIIVSPFEVHKEFSFSGNELTGSNVFINRFLGRNIRCFAFNSTYDPVTGIYDVVTPGTVASASLTITPFFTQASTIGSSSFSVNGTTITLTGSSGGVNQGNVIYVPTGSNNLNTIFNIVSHVNASSSLYFNISNITASANLITPPSIYGSNVIFRSKTTGLINNCNYLVSASVTRSFTGGTTDVVTGSYEYQRLVYRSIQELYYSNYLTCSYGDIDTQPLLIPGSDPTGDRFVGSASSQAHYENYLQSTLSYPRFFPTASDARIGVLSIPNYLFGDYIQPNSLHISFPFNSVNYEFYDDGEGNLRMLNTVYGTSSAIVGNVIYPHGIVTLVGNQSLYDYFNNYINGTVLGSTYASAIYGTSYVYGNILNIAGLITEFVSSSNITCSFSSSYTIYETQYKCTIRENEFNYTLNPSTFTSVSSSFTTTNLGASPCDVASSSIGTSISPGIPYDYVNQDYFSPYITTVGLYDEQQNLLAIGKLSQPLPSSPTTDTTILINIDR
jgi:hypothetical protein